MRILYHHRTLGDGAEGVHVASISEALRRLGHEVEVISLIGKRTNEASSRQRRWAGIARMMPGFVYEIGELGYNVMGRALIERAIREFRPDAIYDRYVNYCYAAVGAARRHRLPMILEVNSPYSFQKQTFDERLYFRGLSRRMERKICSDATRVIVVSTPLRDFLVSIGVPADRIIVMPNGVDAEVFAPRATGKNVRQALNIDDRLVVGFTGILRPWHGLDMLLQAFAGASGGGRPLHLLLVGDGPSRAEVEEQAARLGIQDHVTVTGRLPHATVRDYVAAMDVAVSPRATFYASPMKILEYMAMGKAVIAPDMPNIRDIVTHERDALLFTPERAESLEASLARMLGDEGLRGRLGREARRTVEQGRTWTHNARAVVELFERARAAG